MNDRTKTKRNGKGSEIRATKNRKSWCAIITHVLEGLCEAKKKNEVLPKNVENNMERACGE